jgi:hypothetical protein
MTARFPGVNKRQICKPSAELHLGHSSNCRQDIMSLMILLY